jgi:hypothetical protein
VIKATSDAKALREQVEFNVALRAILMKKVASSNRKQKLTNQDARKCIVNVS